MGFIFGSCIMKLNDQLDINDGNKKMITFVDFNYVFLYI